MINALLLLLLTGYHFSVIRRYGRINVLSPLSFYAAVNVLRIAPYTASILIDPGLVDPRIYGAIGATDFDNVITVYLACELIGALIFFQLLRGANLSWSGRLPQRPRPSPPAGLWLIGLLMACGLALVAARVVAAGGLGFLLANLALRAEITAGYGFLVTPAYFCFAAATVVSVQALAQRRSLRHWLVFSAVVALGAAGMSLFGGRKDALLLACTALIAYAHFVRPLRWNSPIFPIAFLGIVAYTYFLGSARQIGGLAVVSTDPLAIAADGLRDLSTFFKTVSYVDTYLFIISHFQRADHWLLSVFQSFPASFVPSLIYPDKPPVDEGVYIRSMLEGYSLTPPIPAKDLYPSSLPPETLGNGYAAFGMLGVALFFAIKAWCFRRAFRVRLWQWTALPVVLLVSFTYNFQISPLRFMQLLQLLLLCLSANALIRFIRKASR